MPKNWSVGEPTNVYEYLEDKKDKIKVGDTIEYISNNQQGYLKYKVVEEDGEKTLEVIDSYDMQLARLDDEEYGSSSKKSEKGGKKKTKKTKRRTNKKRQNKKRKTAHRK
jgi:hypothetical protein